MSDTVNILAYSEEALSNRSIFLSGLNDINIFVEDVNKEYIYEEIFERLFEDRVSIFCIFPLGGKDAVKQKHETSGMYDSDGKLNLFVVDGDFDNLWDEDKTISPNLIYLDRYNIESYYCTKEAVIKYMRGFLKKPREQIEALMNYDTWLQSVRQEMGELFVLFSLVHHHCPTLPNVSIGASEFLDPNGRIDASKYEHYKERVVEKVGSLDPLLVEIREKIHRQFSGDEEDKVLAIICGKYQIESLCRHLYHCFGKNVNRGAISNVLIMSFDLAPLRFIEDRTIQLISANAGSQHSA